MGTIWSEYVLCDLFYIFFSARLFTEELMEDGMSSYLPDGQSVMNPASSFHAIHSTRILCSAYYAPKIHSYCGGEISQCHLGQHIQHQQELNNFATNFFCEKSPEKDLVSSWGYLRRRLWHNSDISAFCTITCCTAIPPMFNIFLFF